MCLEISLDKNLTSMDKDFIKVKKLILNLYVWYGV